MTTLNESSLVLPIENNSVYTSAKDVSTLFELGGLENKSISCHSNSKSEMSATTTTNNETINTENMNMDLDLDFLNLLEKEFPASLLFQNINHSLENSISEEEKEQHQQQEKNSLEGKITQPISSSSSSSSINTTTSETLSDSNTINPSQQSNSSNVITPAPTLFLQNSILSHDPINASAAFFPYVSNKSFIDNLAQLTKNPSQTTTTTQKKEEMNNAPTAINYRSEYITPVLKSQNNLHSSQDYITPMTKGQTGRSSTRNTNHKTNSPSSSPRSIKKHLNYKFHNVNVDGISGKARANRSNSHHETNTSQSTFLPDSTSSSSTSSSMSIPPTPRQNFLLYQNHQEDLLSPSHHNSYVKKEDVNFKAPSLSLRDEQVRRNLQQAKQLEQLKNLILRQGSLTSTPTPHPLPAVVGNEEMNKLRKIQLLKQIMNTLQQQNSALSQKRLQTHDRIQRPNQMKGWNFLAQNGLMEKLNSMNPNASMEKLNSFGQNGSVEKMIPSLIISNNDSDEGTMAYQDYMMNRTTPTLSTGLTTPVPMVFPNEAINSTATTLSCSPPASPFQDNNRFKFNSIVMDMNMNKYRTPHSVYKKVDGITFPLSPELSPVIEPKLMDYDYHDFHGTHSTNMYDLGMNMNLNLSDFHPHETTIPTSIITPSSTALYQCLSSNTVMKNNANNIFASTDTLQDVLESSSNNEMESILTTTGLVDEDRSILKTPKSEDELSFNNAETEDPLLLAHAMDTNCLSNCSFIHDGQDEEIMMKEKGIHPVEEKDHILKKEDESTIETIEEDADQPLNVLNDIDMNMNMDMDMINMNMSMDQHLTGLDEKDTTLEDIENIESVVDDHDDDSVNTTTSTSSFDHSLVDVYTYAIQTKEASEDKSSASVEPSKEKTSNSIECKESLKDKASLEIKKEIEESQKEKEINSTPLTLDQLRMKEEEEKEHIKKESNRVQFFLKESLFSFLNDDKEKEEEVAEKSLHHSIQQQQQQQQEINSRTSSVMANTRKHKRTSSIKEDEKEVLSKTSITHKVKRPRGRPKKVRDSQITNENILSSITSIVESDKTEEKKMVEEDNKNVQLPQSKEENEKKNKEEDETIESVNGMEDQKREKDEGKKEDVKSVISTAPMLKKTENFQFVLAKVNPTKGSSNEKSSLLSGYIIQKHENDNDEERNTEEEKMNHNDEKDNLKDEEELEDQFDIIHHHQVSVVNDNDVVNDKEDEKKEEVLEEENHHPEVKMEIESEVKEEVEPKKKEIMEQDHLVEKEDEVSVVEKEKEKETYSIVHNLRSRSRKSSATTVVEEEKEKKIESIPSTIESKSKTLEKKKEDDEVLSNEDNEANGVKKNEREGEMKVVEEDKEEKGEEEEEEEEDREIEVRIDLVDSRNRRNREGQAISNYEEELNRLKKKRGRRSKETLLKLKKLKLEEERERKKNKELKEKESLNTTTKAEGKEKDISTNEEKTTDSSENKKEKSEKEVNKKNTGEEEVEEKDEDYIDALTEHRKQKVMRISISQIKTQLNHGNVLSIGNVVLGTNNVSTLKKNGLVLVGRKRIVAENVNRPFVCATCGAGFVRKHDLNRHGKVHTGIKNYKCPYCHRAFSRNDALTRHLRVELKHRSNGIVSTITRGRKKFTSTNKSSTSKSSSSSITNSTSSTSTTTTTNNK